VQKKRGIDQRQDSGGVSKANRVDRVFMPTALAPRPARDSTTSQIATELLASSRAETSSGGDSELSLRRQLARLQRQLSELQRELASKDDEVAAEVEKRLQTQRELEDHAESLRSLQERCETLEAYVTRTTGIEERLADTIATSDELVQLNERERALTASAYKKLEEQQLAFEETRSLWNSERDLLQERAANELAMLDGLRKAAVEASADALNAQAARLREAHEAQLAELRATHEKTLAALRADLEPQAVQAHSLAEERERLIAELATVRNDAIRETVEREEEYKRETARHAEAFAAELATEQRTHATELARVTAEREQLELALQQATKAAETQQKFLETQLESVRNVLKGTQRETLGLKERVTALESEKQSATEAQERSRAEIEALHATQHQLTEQLAARADEIRRSGDERRKFVAYLEEGLALLGALPPTDHATSDAIPVVAPANDSDVH
jgi:DNA repair exonuclease SbcCD ATPase subunit